MVVEITRIRKNGKALYILLTPPIQKQTGWKSGDKLAARPVGDKILLERVRMEDLARLTSTEVSHGV